MKRTLASLVLAIAVFGVGPALAQPGSVAGTVVDPDGRPTPDATVLISDQSAVRDTAVTDGQGRFQSGNLPAGRYELAVVLPGFRAAPTTV
ncbi:MAG TPA: carboxypeptidase regulatory-like domain-containing protein, partial [Acidobacteria bacterium]|nr:carboxypeptidase regulatory-like domain-containing protein [Acidobacteriota bacterium]